MLKIQLLVLKNQAVHDSFWNFDICLYFKIIQSKKLFLLILINNEK